MKQYKAIFLDWDDTIGDWTNAEHQALHDIYATYHLNTLYPTPEHYIAAYKPYNLQLWGQYGRGEISKQYLHLQRFLHPLLGNGANAENAENGENGALIHTAQEIGDAFLQLTNRYFRLLPDAEQVVRYLASKYPLTIVSNGFREVQYYKFAHSGLQDCLTHTLISDEIGINKPQPEIFRVALERNGITADEAVMIGDSYSSDIAGAKAAGIDQIWVTGDGGQVTEQTATYIVPKITDIMKIL